MAIQYPILRNLNNVPDNFDPEIIIKIAESEDEFEGAFKVLHDAYVEENFIEAHPDAIRPTKYHLSMNTSLVIVKRKNEVIGTLSIIRNSSIPLPIESIYAKNLISSKLNKNAYHAEISCLAIKKSERRQNGGQIFFPLLKFMYEYCYNYFGVETILIAIHPKDRFFYEGLLLFNSIEERVIDNYMGAPALGMYLNLKQAKERYKQVYALKSGRKNLYKFFVEERMANLVYPNREFYKIHDNELTNELIQNLFIQKTNLISKLEKQEVTALINSNPVLTKIPELSNLNNELSRSADRIDSYLNGIIFTPLLAQSNSAITVYNTSESGIKFTTQQNLEINSICRVRLNLSKDATTELSIMIRWKDQSQNYGASILKNDENWTQYMAYLYLSVTKKYINSNKQQNKRSA